MRHENKLSVLVVVVCAIIIAALLMSEPQVAWNSGARERMKEALRGIAVGVRVDDERHVDYSDFVATASDGDRFGGSDRAIVLLKRHGLWLSWRRDGRYEKVLFYPIAICSQASASGQRNDCTPCLVIVPIAEEDVPTLPTLYGCASDDPVRRQERQFRRMAKLYADHGMEYAATLMTDGSNMFVEVQELFDQPPACDGSNLLGKTDAIRRMSR